MRFLGLAAVVVAVYLLLKPKGQAAASPAAGAPPATNSDALDNIMQAIFQKEGGHPGNRNIVNNNPGDVKSAANMTGTAGGYATFADIGDGWDALKAWIQSHISAHPDWDFYDTFDYYLRGSTTAPSNDKQGNSDAYAEYVANYAGFDPTQTVSSALGYTA
jgi:hypothetical protein